MPEDSQWCSVDTQADLDALDSSSCWPDSRCLEFYGLSQSERYFPGDISRSGYEHPNVHLFVELSGSRHTHMHVVCIDCDWYQTAFLSQPDFRGRVDTLRRVEVTDSYGSTRMRCSRLVYQFLDLTDYPQSPFLAELLHPHLPEI